MKNLWEEVKEKCLDNASKCMEDGAFKDAERLLKMALGIHNAVASEIQPVIDFGCGTLTADDKTISLEYESLDSNEKEEADQMEVLATLAQPIIEYLRKNHHPYMSVVVIADRVSLEETQMWVPFPTLD